MTSGIKSVNVGKVVEGMLMGRASLNESNLNDTERAIAWLSGGNPGTANALAALANHPEGHSVLREILSTNLNFGDGKLSQLLSKFGTERMGDFVSAVKDYMASREDFW